MFQNTFDNGDHFGTACVSIVVGTICDIGVYRMLFVRFLMQFITPCFLYQYDMWHVQIKWHLPMGIYSPDLFCTPEELAHLLLESGDGHYAKHDRGVKIIHLVRNPFAMAVSNYHYHAQIPT